MDPQVPVDGYENHLKDEYTVEKGDNSLIITARSCYRLNEEAVWLISCLPKEGTWQTYLQALSELGLKEARKILDRLITIGVLRPKSRPAALTRLAAILLAPDIRFLPAGWQEKALRWAGIRPSEVWLKATWALCLLPAVALCLGLACFAGGTLGALEQMSLGRPNAGAIFLMLMFGSLVHEVGHSFAASACGIGLRPIGFSVYLFFPVFYSNVSGMENLPLSRKAAIDSAGLVLQSGYLVALGALWLVLRDISILESIRWMALVMLLNLNPLLRTDAYWLWRDLRTGLPRTRVADLLHLVYLVAFSGFTLYLFYRVLEGIRPIASILLAAFDHPSLLLDDGYRIVIGTYLLALIFAGGVQRLRESRQELLELQHLRQTPMACG